MFTLVLSVDCLSGQTTETKSDETESEKVISVCPFQIGERGKTANFRFSFSYILEVGKDGEITKIEELASTKKYSAYKFVRDDLFIDCMKKWQLKPAGKYFVQFNVGTTSSGTSKDLPHDYVLIVDPNKHRLVLDLSFSENDKLVKSK